MIWTDEMKSAAMKDATQVVKLTERVAELEALVVSMQRAVPGGSVVDTQWMADELRRLATEAGVKVPD